MNRSVGIVGAGVTGLTCGVLLAERGYRVSIFAKDVGRQTTSGVAAALWFPYDAEPAARVIPWALETYRVLVDLTRDRKTGVSMIELRQFARDHDLPIPEWAVPLGARRILIPPEQASTFRDGFAINVPLTDTTIYLDYLAYRFVRSGGRILANIWFQKLEEIDSEFGLVINCAGIGARKLVADPELEPHRGQVAMVPRIENLHCAIVCDGPPLMYAIPRRNDCVFGGTNEISDSLDIDPMSTTRIVAECRRVVGIEEPQVLAERVGLRPFRKSGIRVESGRLEDGRFLVHNYGHGGSGFTLSWGCGEDVLQLADQICS